MGKKLLDDDDISIWRQVAETVTPILRQSFTAKPTPKIDDLKKPSKKPVSKQVSSTTAMPATPSSNILPKAIRKDTALTPADLNRPGYGGISRAGARSIKSGKSGYTQKIDLHGLSREKAGIKLRHFIQSSASNGHRHVLVITGKGTEGKGVIKKNFPDWLNKPPLSDLVIAYCQAQPKDGGGGAWYVYLRS